MFPKIFTSLPRKNIATLNIIPRYDRSASKTNEDVDATRIVSWKARYVVTSRQPRSVNTLAELKRIIRVENNNKASRPETFKIKQRIEADANNRRLVSRSIILRTRSAYQWRADFYYAFARARARIFWRKFSGLLQIWTAVKRIGGKKTKI